jgi:Ca2+-binding EF-hand superfamily protein
VVETIRQKIIERGGTHGIRGIARSFRIMDNSNDKSLTFLEFKFGLKDYGLKDIPDKDLQTCFIYFDRDGSQTMNFDEFIRGVRGKLNERRTNLIGLAFDKLDKTGNGVVELNDLQGVYNGSMHPDVMSGEKTEDQVLSEFMEQWDTLEQDGVVTFEEFCDYYKDVSCSIDDDDYFELMIRNAWKI